MKGSATKLVTSENKMEVAAFHKIQGYGST